MGKKIHELKTWPSFFEAALDGSKRFEIRKHDRDFAVGDRLVLCEYTPPDGYTFRGRYTGRRISALITYVLQGGKYGIDQYHCILGFIPQPEEDK